MFDNIGNIVETSSLALLGLLGVFVVLGILFGLIRGRKKTTIRIITILIALPLALLLTPVFSKTLLKINVPFDGETLSVSAHIKKFIMSALPDKVSIDGISAVPQLVEGLAVVVINLVMFLILYFVFKWISWIFYAVISAKAAPKKQRIRTVGADGVERIDVVAAKKGRLSGALLGVVQALIFFAFFMIPITGIISVLDKTANYHPQMAGFSSASVRSSYDGGLMDIYNGIDDFDSTIQSSAFGVISKYSGMQALGGAGISYLSSFKVNGQKINLKNDATYGIRLFKDITAVYQEFSDERSFMEVIESWDEDEYAFVKSVIERVFSVTFVQLIFESSDAVVDIVNDTGVIDGKLDRFDEAGHEGDFQASAVKALKDILTSEKIKHDLLNAVDLMQALFRIKEVNLPGDTVEDLSIYRSMKAVFNAFKDNGDVKAEAEKLTALLESARKGNSVTQTNPNIAFDLMKAIFGFNFVQEILADDTISQLYQKPIEKYVPNVSEGKAVFNFDFGTAEKANLVYLEMAELLVNVSDCLGVVSGLIGDDMMDSLSKMGPDDIGAFAGLMASLTNSEIIGTFVRNLAIGFLDSSKVAGLIGEFDALKDVDLFGAIIQKLDPDNKDLDAAFWEKEIKVVIDLVKFAIEFKNGDSGELTKSLGDLLASVGGSELLRGAVCDLIESLVGDVLGKGALVIKPEAFEVLADIAGGLVAVMDSGTLPSGEFFDTLFGDEGGVDALLKLAGKGQGEDGGYGNPLIQIDLGGILGESESVEQLLKGFLEQSLGQSHGEDIDSILNMFRLSPGGA